jgi:predicted molibdopterin-dependent oxidoreductase YjgC
MVERGGLNEGDDAMFVRAVARETAEIGFCLDGRELAAQAGDSVLAAILTNGDCLRVHEFSGTGRAGFCLMGACQDCFVWCEDGERLRACTTLLAPGMRLRTTPPHFEVGSDA